MSGIHFPMPTETSRAMFKLKAPERMELVVHLPAGETWTVSGSPGIQRFIGFYPRIPGIDGGTGLLEYRPVRAAG